LRGYKYHILFPETDQFGVPKYIENNLPTSRQISRFKQTKVNRIGTSLKAIVKEKKTVEAARLFLNSLKFRSDLPDYEMYVFRPYISDDGNTIVIPFSSL